MFFGYLKMMLKLIYIVLQKVEERLSDLVVKGSIYARIDRPAGIINFRKPSSPVDTLNDWKGNVSELLNLIEKTCHLVQRENMVYQHAKVRGGK